MSTELRRVQRHRARPVWPLRDVDACRRTMGMGRQAVVRDVGCFLLMNFVICKKMYNIYIYRYILYIFCLLKWQVNDVNLCFFFGGGHVQPSQESMQRNRSLDILVTAMFHRTLSWWGLAIRPVGEIFGMMLGWRKKSFDTRCSFLDYGGHDGLNGLEHCEDFFKRSLWVFQTEVLRPKIPCDLSRFCWPCFHLECIFFFGPPRHLRIIPLHTLSTERSRL